MDAQNPDPAQVSHIVAMMFPIIALVVLIFQALIVVPLWIALKKAGLAGPLALIAFIPTLGLIVVLFILAFANWKVVPAPLYNAGYPTQIPPPAYPPVYAQGTAPIAPSATNYSAPGAYTPASAATPAAYPPPSEPPSSL